jgi:hypothetical protein
MLLLIVFVATNAFSDGWSFFQSYYSDGTWATQVGEIDKECDGSISQQWGTTSSFRLLNSTNCINGKGFFECQQLVNGAWIPIECP